jgi:general secretion pathway protein D
MKNLLMIHFRLAKRALSSLIIDPQHKPANSPVSFHMTRSSGHVLKELRILPLVAAASIAGASLLHAGETTGGLPSIAEREIARRMARMEDARQAIESGDKAYAKGQYEDALGNYRAALDTVPEAPATAEWRNVAEAKFADAAVGVALDMAKTGRYEDAHKRLDEALAINPEHKEALKAKKRINDPERYPVALTPDHVTKVEKVERSLLMGNSYEDIGDHDKAIESFQDALRTDRHNIAGRRGIERVEQSRAQYFDAARDQMRASLLNQVNEGWEMRVPTDIQPALNGNIGAVVANGGKYLTEKMRRIIFPTVQFSGATIDEAIEFLRIKSRDLDNEETDPTKRGVNIILKPAEGAPPASISLDLKDVPMEEALRYITELASMKVKVESFAVLVVPISEQSTEQTTRIFRVPPDFLQSAGGDAGAGAAPAAADPFAPAAAAPTTNLIKKLSALEVLKGQGILFPEGSSAVFNAGTSQLIVRNTIPNLDLVEAYVDSLQKQAPKMIFITAKFVEVSQKNTDELGFDWLLGPFNVPSSARTFGSGGTVGNSQNGGIAGASGGVTEFPFLMPSGAVVGRNPVTRGNRSGSFAIEPDSIDGLISGNANNNNVAPGLFALSGVLTDPQFQVVIRGLAQRKGVDLMSAPSVTTKSGQRATIEVIREFYYPTEFDPPEIPQQFGSVAGGSTNLVTGTQTGGGSFPVTPTTPTAFEMKPIGVRMEVDPTVGADGYTIELNMAPEVNEFEGFINYGSPIQTSGQDALGNPVSVVLTENKIVQPVFSTRKVQTAVTVWDGQTVAMGGLIREDVQDVEDRVPILGDIPILGRLFQTKAEDHFKRNLMIFVTAKLIDPAGRDIKPATPTDGATPAGNGDAAANPLFPAGGGAQ